jgi:pyruvate-formate lyase-activating enzyme
VAGEEPLFYNGLQAVCREAHRRGMLTSMIINSTTPSAAQLEWLRFAIDLLGLAIDARAVRPRPARRTSRAAKAMEDRLELVRRSGIPFAIVFTLTPNTLGDLEWAAEFASAEGALVAGLPRPASLTNDATGMAGMSRCLPRPAGHH